MFRRSALFTLISISLAMFSCPVVYAHPHAHAHLHAHAHPHPELENPVQDSLTIHHDRPPLNGGKIAMEAVAGVAVGVTFAYAGALVGAGANEGEGYNDLGAAILGFLIGGTIGNAVGIYAVGVSGNEDGSFGATLGGSLVGTMGMLAVAAASDGSEGSDGLMVLALSLPVVGGVMAFNHSRTYESGHYTDHAEHVWDQAPGPNALEKLHEGSEAKGHQFKILSTTF